MHKRRLVGIVQDSTIENDYGGYIDNPIVEQTISGTLEGVEGVTIQGRSGVVTDHQAWLKTHMKIEDWEHKLLMIDDELYRIVKAVHNRRRWFYQVEGD